MPIHTSSLLFHYSVVFLIIWLSSNSDETTQIVSALI